MHAKRKRAVDNSANSPAANTLRHAPSAHEKQLALHDLRPPRGATAEVKNDKKPPNRRTAKAAPGPVGHPKHSRRRPSKRRTAKCCLVGAARDAPLNLQFLGKEGNQKGFGELHATVVKDDRGVKVHADFVAESRPVQKPTSRSTQTHQVGRNQSRNKLQRRSGV